MIETLTITRNITDKKEKVKWDFINVGSLTYIEYWDSHGSTIVQDKKNFENVHVKIAERSWKEFGQKWKIYVAYIDGKELDGEITSVQGNEYRLIIKGCVGAG